MILLFIFVVFKFKILHKISSDDICLFMWKNEKKHTVRLKIRFLFYFSTNQMNDYENCSYETAFFTKKKSKILFFNCFFK